MCVYGACGCGPTSRRVEKGRGLDKGCLKKKGQRKRRLIGRVGISSGNFKEKNA